MVNLGYEAQTPTPCKNRPIKNSHIFAEIIPHYSISERMSGSTSKLRTLQNNSDKRLVGYSGSFEAVTPLFNLINIEKIGTMR